MEQPTQSQPTQTPEPQNTQPTNQEPTGSDDADEWGEAIESFAEDNGYDIELEKDTEEEVEEPEQEGSPQQPEPEQKPTEEGQDKEAETDGEEEQKPQEEQEGAEPEQQEADPREDSIREQRSIQRRLEAEQEAMKEDIKEKLYDDVQTELLDADGDPIKGIEDVKKLINPKTQEPFTDEEAARWLMQAQDHMEQKQKEMNQQVEQIAETNLTIKDEADTVRERYGALLEAMPDLRKQVWEAFEKTLERDPDTGIITKAPVSLEQFYNTTLAGYDKLAKQLEAQEKEQEELKKQHNEEQKKKEVEVKKAHNRNDREDLYSRGQTDTMDPEEREWAEAAEEVLDY